MLIPQNRDSRLDKSDLLLVGDLNLLSALSTWQRGVFYGSQGRETHRLVYENDLFASFFFLRGNLIRRIKYAPWPHCLSAEFQKALEAFIDGNQEFLSKLGRFGL